MDGTNVARLEPAYSQAAAAAVLTLSPPRGRLCAYGVNEPSVAVGTRPVACELVNQL